MSEFKESEKFNKNNSLKIFDNFVAACHLLCVGGGHQPDAGQETKRNPAGVPTQGFCKQEDLGEKNDLPYNRH